MQVKKMMNNKKINYGGILAYTLLLGLCGVTFVLGFYGWSNNKNFYYNRKIAEIKAFYNAETGMAREAYEYLWKVDFIDGFDGLEGDEINDNMGFYLKPNFKFDSYGNRVAEVYGIHEIRTSSGTMYPCSALVSLPARPQTLGIYMYLTDSEEAGGAPFVFDSPGDRRDVFFGDLDVLEGVIQTNGELSVSDYGCPNFGDATVYLTNSTPVNLGQCSDYQELFGGGWNAEVDTMSKPPVKLPPTGYETLKNVATHIIEADIKITPAVSIKDTLIMTDIKFTSDGNYNVKKWWYLMPPHLIAGLSSAEVSEPKAEDLDLDDCGECTGHDHISGDGSLECSLSTSNDDIRTCPAYLNFLGDYHAKENTQSFQNTENLLNSTITGASGFHHFDIDSEINFLGNVTSENIFSDQTFPGSDNTVIYVKGGPVTVSGKFKGKYSIVTDEYSLYRRHAWPDLDDTAPVDTVWNNIWITGDLINTDAIGLSTGNPVYASHGNLSELQPDSGCQGGSQNIMGLISGANIYIANTKANGAGNLTSQGNIIINAGLIALNESFVIQYWQNTTSLSSANGGIYTNNYPPFYSQLSNQTPFGDGRGDDISNTGGSDLRGYVYLWGGVVQKHRGYMKRSYPSPYGNAQIGMDKSYHYDANLDCNPPPFYPAVEFDDGSGEIDIKMIGYSSSF